MTLFEMVGVLIVGVALLVIGIVTKKKWLMIVSAIPLLLFLCQIIALFLIGIH